MNERDPGRKAVDLWYCAGCEAVHILAGDVRLSFDRDEFNAFTEKAVDLNFRGWPSSERQEPIRIGESVSIVDDIVLSSRVH